MRVDAGAGAQRRLCQPAHESEWLHRAAAPVEEPAAVERRSGELQYLAAREERHRRPAPQPLLDASRQLRQRGLGSGGLDPAGALCLAFDAVACDELEHQVGPGACGRHQAPAGVGTEQPLHGVRVWFDTRNDLTAVEARSALADLCRLEHYHLAPRLGQVQRGG